MVTCMRRCTGFTLIEMVVTIAIVAILAVLAVPLTGTWSADARLSTNGSLIRRGGDMAQAVALRNPLGIADQTQPAAILKMSGQNIMVCSQAPCDSSHSVNIVWSAALPANVNGSLTQGGTQVSSISFNNRGLPLGASAQVGYTISTGSVSDSQSLY